MTGNGSIETLELLHDLVVDAKDDLPSDASVSALLNYLTRRLDTRIELAKEEAGIITKVDKDE